MTPTSVPGPLPPSSNAACMPRMYNLLCGRLGRTARGLVAGHTSFTSFISKHLYPSAQRCKSSLWLVRGKKIARVGLVRKEYPAGSGSGSGPPDPTARGTPFYSSVKGQQTEGDTACYLPSCY